MKLSARGIISLLLSISSTTFLLYGSAITYAKPRGTPGFNLVLHHINHNHPVVTAPKAETLLARNVFSANLLGKPILIDPTILAM